MRTSFREKAEYHAAQMYYAENRTMESIAGELGISRSTVSRLLAEARDQGIVRISLHPPIERPSALEHLISERHGVAAHVAASTPETEPSQRRDAVAVLAAEVLDALVRPDAVIGVAWGQTMTSVVTRLPRRPVRNVEVVQLNGAVNSQPEGTSVGLGTGMSVVENFARAFDARAHVFAVPAFFDYEETKEALWRERSTLRVLDLHHRATVAVFGVGTFGQGAPSQVYAGGYLSREDIDALTAERAVGDVCTVYLRADGSWEDIGLNRRSSGPSPDALRGVPRRVCVVNGPQKVPALRAALAAGLVTDLVIDQVSADLLAGSAAG
ncbi:sugar-binding transcriptional regulator [Nesterenkonia halobia]|uniref:Sugar-binding transcriptional regulator n=1 Tax=Nesterenkonia halobia TaxID=37922 RepID=A0ABP6RL12_9MICC